MLKSSQYTFPKNLVLYFIILSQIDKNSKVLRPKGIQCQFFKDRRINCI